MGEKKFDYAKAMARLEEIAAKVENPESGIEDIDKYIDESKALVEACRKYLRSVKDKAGEMGI